jgi:ABC-2 type transport system permease protein
MRKLFSVVRREYLARVRSKGFVIGTVLGPVLMVGVLLGPAVLAARQAAKPQRLAVLDAGGALGPAVAASLERAKCVVVDAGRGPVEEVRARLRGRVLDGELDAYVFLPADAVERSTVEYHGKGGGSRPVAQALEQAFLRFRLESHGLQPGQIDDAARKVEVKTMRVSATGEQEDRGGTFALAFMLVMMIYMSLILWGADIMNGVIEEKTSRVVEVVVSSVTPRTLFLGKLLGGGGAGLTQFAVWAATLVGVSAYGANLASVVGTPLPPVTPLLVAGFLACFVLGFFIYGALYAMVGAAVNNPQEAQSLAFPAVAPLILSVVFAPVVIRQPDSTLSTVLSLIPFMTPILMYLRIAVFPPPAWQVALSFVLVVLAILAVVWAAARIYRVGILMYGKRPTLPEMIRWMRYS